MKVGAVASLFAPMTPPSRLSELAVALDRGGFDSLWFGEHVLLFDEMEFGYPGSPDGKLPVPSGQGAPDQASVIGFLAGQTRTLRFGTSISLIPQRNPIYTAKEFATLDWLAQGRISLGVGVGWCKEEVEACGYAWKTRGQRCDEALELMTRLWTEDEVTHQGEHFSVRGARMDPKPMQNPHIPLIIGGYSQAAMRRTARFGAGWLGFGLTPAMAKPLLEMLDVELEQAGRARDELEVVMMPADDGLDAAREFAALGVDTLTPMVDPNADIHARLEHLAHLKTSLS